ncbi:hypothetical protein FB451DRAFT_1549156 [Mycena latifolia]|nr:hypothetical protein FB451DRAFT_1549156 [Mycena latifolia]
MFSKLLILGLSALSIVGANSSLRTPGLYQISQPAPGGPYSEKYVQTVGDEAPLHVLPPTGHEQYLPMWWVRMVGKDQYHLELYGNPGIRAASNGSDLVIGSRDTELLSTWAIESAGNDHWVVKIPGQDAVWKYNSDSTVDLAPADGTVDEHWKFNYYGGP